MIRNLALLLQKTAHLLGEVVEKTGWGVFFAPIIIFFEKYIFSDWGFFKYLLVFIILDTLLGLGYALWKREVSSQKAAGILIKAVIYGPVMILGHVFENFEVSGAAMEGGFYIKATFYTGLMIVEGISVIKNLGKINKRLVPQFILKRLEGFNDTGDFNELTKKDESNNPFTK